MWRNAMRWRWWSASQDPEELKAMSAVIETQRQLEDVVDDLLSSVHGVPKRRVDPSVYDTEDIT